MKLWFALTALTVTTALAAQTAPDPRARLEAARSEATAARQRSAQLDAEARSAGGEAERARAAQAAIAARIQASEAEIGVAETRLAMLKNLQREQEQRLAEKQQPITKLIAALQTMARRPAAAALVQPGSLDDLVHVRALLVATRPQIAARTAALRSELDRARALRGDAAQTVAALRENRQQARIEQRRLAQLELRERRRSAAFAGSARLEADRALALGEGSRDLEELVRKLDTQSALGVRLASLPGPLPRPARPSDALPAEPVPAHPQRLDYRLPVLGPITRGFGEALASGSRSRGVAIAARSGAIVVAPASGRVTFAGLYRGYGGIAIVDHGDGYTSLVTGLASNLARIGDIVDQGSPLGRAGTNGVTVELRRAGQAIDFSTLVG